MRAADLDLLFVPEGPLPGPDHWQARWSQRLSSARFVEPEGRATPQALVTAARAATRPVFFIAHSVGAILVAQAAPLLAGLDVRGAFLVAPPADEALATLEGGVWGASPRQPLPFRSLVVASRTDPWASLSQSQRLAQDWGAEFVDAGEAGRLDAEGGFGPWTDGLLRLAAVLKTL